VKPADVIVVGAGSAGAVLAARLSERPDRRVLLIEAGPVDRSPLVHVPAGFSRLFESPYDWDYWTVPQPGLGGRSIYWPRGRGLGGSSSINAMMWVPGFPQDFASWAQWAGPAWSWDRVRAALDRVSVAVEPQRSPHPLTEAFLEAVRECGYRVDSTGWPGTDGFTRTLVTQRRGRRHSSADAYLRPARRRANLEVLTDTLVTRVLIDRGRAHGVEVLRRGRTERIGATGEVVLAAGAINSPQLLLLSGIGDPDHLRTVGIEPLVELRGVGEHLLDHLVAGIVAQTDEPTLRHATSPQAALAYLARRRGPLSSNVAEAYGFVRSDPALELADLEIIWAPVAYLEQGLRPVDVDGITVGAILLEPRSHGRVRLASADPRAKPLIDPRYLSDEAGVDLARLAEGLARCEELLQAPSLRRHWTGKYIVPELHADEDLTERRRRTIVDYAHTLYHPTSTCRMGTSENAVVDAELRVRGVEGLRVVDASVMPTIPHGHTNAATLAIGELGAELIDRALR
jgi:choline dehydrogenase